MDADGLIDLMLMNGPEYECWVPVCSDVPATLQIPSFLLMAFLNVLATSLLFSPWTI